MVPGRQVTLVSASEQQPYEAIVVDVESARVKVKVLARRSERRMLNPVRSIIFALTKGDNNELVIEKACELGVEHILLWQAERSVVRIASDQERAKKLERWNKIAKSAAEQSKQAFIPALNLARTQKELFEIMQVLVEPADLRLICSLSPASVPINTLATDFTRVHLVVGPEGDFSPAEETEFLKREFRPVSLGPYRLRAETAAITAIAMTQASFGFKDSL